MQSRRSSESTGRVRVERGIYRQTNGRYAVCVIIDGRPSLRTFADDVEQARVERELLREAAHNGLVTIWPRLTFGAVALPVAGAVRNRVVTRERRERTLENSRYYLDHHLLPELGRKRIRSLTPGDIAGLVAALTAKGLAPKTVANALVPLGGILRFARRRGYILDDPLRRLEKAERPRPRSPRAARPRPDRDRGAAARLRAAPPARCWRRLSTAGCVSPSCSPSPGPRLTLKPASSASAHSSRRRTWEPPPSGWRPRRGPASATSRSPPQLATVLAGERARARFSADNDYVFATRLGTPLGQRNVARTALAHAVRRAGLDGRGRPPLRFHDLRHRFASHLIVDLRLDVCQVSRILGHARTAITPGVYTHLFERARHAADLRTAMAGSRFAQILAEATAAEPWLAENAKPRARIGRLRERNARSSAAASVAKRANARVLDNGLTNAFRPWSRRRSLRNPADYQGFRWS